MEVVEIAIALQFIRLDEQRIDVHVRRSITDAPFNAFDYDEIAERIAVECVEKEKTARF